MVKVIVWVTIYTLVRYRPAYGNIVVIAIHSKAVVTTVFSVGPVIDQLIISFSKRLTVPQLQLSSEVFVKSMNCSEIWVGKKLMVI